MEGNGLHPIYLHLVQKQIVFVPLYFAIDRYLFFCLCPCQMVLKGETVVSELQHEAVPPLCWMSLEDFIHAQSQT